MANENKNESVSAVGKSSQAAGRDAKMETRGDNSPIITGDKNTINYYQKCLVIPLLNEDGSPKKDSSGKTLQLIIPEKSAVKIFGSNKKALVSLLTGDIDSMKKVFTNQAVKDALSEKNIKINYIDSKNNATLKKMLDRAIDEREAIKKDGTLMAESVYSSLKRNKASLRSVRSFALKAKNRFFYFIAAITKKCDTDENTLEYKVAKILRDKLGRDNVFWWEDPIDCDKEEQSNAATSDLTNKWFISTKIAMGLGFSSVFIGLAFDTIKPTTNGYDFKCLLAGEDAYKEPEYFLYEATTFIGFLKDKKNSEKFVKKIVSKNDNKELVPQDRRIRIYSCGEPDRSKFSYEVIDNIEKRNGFYIDTAEGDFKRIYESSQSIDEKAAKIAQIIFDRISKEQAEKQLPYPQNEIERRNEYLFLPFNPSSFLEGQYGDEFLSYQWGKNKYEWLKNFTLEDYSELDLTNPNSEYYLKYARDYYFKYAVIDNAGKNARNHFLIFPERDNDLDGNFRWRLKLVIRDWNLRAIVDNSYREYLLTDSSGRSFTPTNDDFELTKYSTIEFFQGIKKVDEIKANTPNTKSAIGEEYSTNNCTFTLRNNIFNFQNPLYNLNGILKFSSQGDSTITPKYYYISVEFWPRKIVYNRGKNSDVEVHLPLFRTVQDNKYITSTKCPCCGRVMTTNVKFQGNGDYCYSDEKLPYRTCEYNFIGYSYRVNRSIEKTTDYQLVFDDKNNRYGSVEDKDNAGHDTEYGKIVNSLASSGSGMKIVNDNSRLRYPKVYAKNDMAGGVVITFMGVSQSGKSTFISSLFGVDGGLSKKPYDGNISIEYIKKALRPYIDDVENLVLTTNELNNDVKNTLLPEKRFGISGIRLLEAYSIKKYSSSVEKTSTKVDPVLPHIPFILNLKGVQSTLNKEVFLSFFDLPGGLLEQDQSVMLHQMNDDYTMIYRSDSIILLLNDEEDSPNTQSKINKMITILEKLTDKKTVIAIVLCKADEYLSDDFLSDKMVATGAPASRETKFDGSRRKRFIDVCSKNVEQYIGKKYPSLYDSLRKIFALPDRDSDESEHIRNSINRKEDTDSKFTNYKFFAVSSIGRSDAIIFKGEGATKTPYTVYTTTPLNMENILMWIMFMKGIIE